MKNKPIDEKLNEFSAIDLVTTKLFLEPDKDHYTELSRERTALLEEWTRIQDKADDLYETIPYEVRCPRIELGIISIYGFSYVLSVYNRTYATSIDDIELCREQFAHSQTSIAKEHFEKLSREVLAAKAHARAAEDRVGYTAEEARAKKLRNQIFELEKHMLVFQQDYIFDDEFEYRFD